MKYILILLNIYLVQFSHAQYTPTTNLELAFDSVCASLTESVPCSHSRIQHFIATIPYPHELYSSGIEGTVYISFDIEIDGIVKKSRLLQTSGHRWLDDIALEHILNLPQFYRSQIINGEPVKSTLNIPVTFRSSETDSKVFDNANIFPIFSKACPSLDNETIVQHNLEKINSILQSKEYPKKAKKNNKEGTVKISFLIDSEGNISTVRISESSGDNSLDNDAFKNISTLKSFYKPAILLKKPVLFKYYIDIVYVL